MRYRELSATGDYTFGRGSGNFLVNSPACVAQAVLTRLKLLQGEWFLDVTEGTPYLQKVMGYNTVSRDQVIKQRILQTQGVTSIVDYNSTLDPRTRAFSVTATIDTIYGQTTVSA